MSVQQTLSALLSEGGVAQTLDALKNIFETAGDKRRIQELVLIKSRYSQMDAEQRAGTISAEDLRLEKNRISKALSDLIAEVPENAVLPADLVLQKGSNAPAPDPSGRNEKQHAPPANSSGTKIPLFIGIVALLAAVVFIVVFPCPSATQFFVIRLLMALGVGALAYYLPGSLDLSLSEGIKAGGALAVLAMIYLLNPADGFVKDDCDVEKHITVFVHGAKGCTDLILQEKGEVIMRLESTGETKKEPISNKGEAKFSGLRVGQKVHLEIDFSEPYRAVRPDSVYTISKEGSFCLEIALQNLDKVFGRVVYKDQPLAGVVVSIGSALRDTTDDLGNYNLLIPREQQKKAQEVTFFKPGFKFVSKTAYPQTAEALNLVMGK